MELEEPINFRKLLEKPIVFKIDRKQLDRFDEHLLDDIDDDDYDEKNVPQKKTSPWLQSFDELKKTMLPIPKYANIYKQTISEGTGEVMGMRMCRIKWIYSLFMESEESSFDSSCLGSSNVKTDTTDEVFPGILLALATMRKDEESQFVIGYEWMYGKFGHMVGEIKVKPEADVLLVVQLVNFQEIGADNACDRLTDQQLEHFPTVKPRALEMQKKVLDLHGKHKFSSAIQLSLKIIEHIQFCEAETEDEVQEKNEFLAEVYTKLIDCYVKAENYKKACNMIHDLRQLTDVEQNVSALTNEAIALSKIGDDFNRPIELLRKAQKLEPNSEWVNKTLIDILDARDKYKNDTKCFMMKAFQVKPDEQMQANKAKIEAPVNQKLLDIIKSFNDIDIGSGIPLTGYTNDELKMVEVVILHEPNLKLQVTRNHDGQLNYTIKKTT